MWNLNAPALAAKYGCPASRLACDSRPAIPTCRCDNLARRCSDGERSGMLRSQQEGKFKCMGGALCTNEAMAARRRACHPATHLTASCTSASRDVSRRRRPSKRVQHFKAEPRQRRALLRHMCMTTAIAHEAHKASFATLGEEPRHALHNWQEKKKQEKKKKENSQQARGRPGKPFYVCLRRLGTPQTPTDRRTEMEDRRATVTDALQSTTFRLYSSAAAPVTGTVAPRHPLPRCQGTKCRPGTPEIRNP